MRHVVIDGPGRVSVDQAPDPSAPGPGGAVVSVDAAAICGSDMHFYDGDLDLGMAIPVGHEFLGTVLEVGPDVRQFQVGDRVLTASVAGCGACEGCATGDPVLLPPLRRLPNRVHQCLHDPHKGHFKGSHR